VAFDCTSQEKAAHGHVVHAVQEVPFWTPFDAVFDTSCPGNERFAVIYVAVRCLFGFGTPDAVWRRPRRLHDYKNPLPPLRPLHTALSSPAHSHAFCHAGLNRRPSHHPPRASSSPAKAV